MREFFVVVVKGNATHTFEALFTRKAAATKWRAGQEAKFRKTLVVLKVAVPHNFGDYMKVITEPTKS